ncbi:MAG: peptide chain release factor N(5)-glutamine methyltransferase [Arcobacteraceae bacterium]|jgi:release factor glutamine methyltransferase|nr:peptide chain release factor N(5)-glutamine methyltransferase [Arcobacteraceae bacterium]
MTIKQTIQEQSQKLKEITHIPAKEVEILIGHLLNKNTIWLHLNYHQEFEQQKELEKLIQKRATHYPLEYLIGKASFYGEIFYTKEGVLIPRPETELLVEHAITCLNNLPKKPKRVLEIGVGSGVISIMLALLVENIEIVGIDINPIALQLAKENALKHNVLDKINFIQSDLFDNVVGDFDMVISNPPYIANEYILPHNVKYEPHNALFAGEVGDELLKQIIVQTHQRNIPYLFCEMGYDQKPSLSQFLKQFSTNKVEFYKDYAQFDRGFWVEFNH